MAVHDPFSFSIAEAGWQEERATAGEFETRVVLSRVADPQQRLTFLSGSTGPAGPVNLDPAAFDIPGFKVGQPSDVTISEMPGKYIDIEPDGSGVAASVAIDTQTIPVDPGRAYRFTIVRIPMDQEAATVIMVTEAPTDAFATFVELADQVIQERGNSRFCLERDADPSDFEAAARGPACPKATPARDLGPYWQPKPKLQSTVTDAGADRLPAPSTAMTSIVFTTPRSAYRIAAVRPPPIGWSNRPFRKTS